MNPANGTIAQTPDADGLGDREEAGVSPFARPWLPFAQALRMVSSRLSDVGEATRTFVVGVDGRSGSGKTTFASMLAADLRDSGATVATVEVEDLIAGWDGLVDGTRRVADRLLLPVVQQGWAELETWDWHANRWSLPRRIPRSGRVDILLLAGCGASSAPCAPSLDLSVWLEVGEAERRRRVTARDGDPSAWWSAWALQEDRLLATRDSPSAADVRVRAE